MNLTRTVGATSPSGHGADDARSVQGPGDGVLSKRASGRLIAAFFLATGVVMALSLPLRHAAEVNRLGLATLVLVAAGVAGGAWLAPWDRWPRRATLWLAPVGFTLIAAGNGFSGPRPATYSIFFAALFVWLGVAHPRWTSVRLAPIAAAAYVVPLVLQPGDLMENAGSVLVNIPVFVLIGESLSWLTHRLARTEQWLEADVKYQTLVEQIPAIVYIAEHGERGDWLYVSPHIEAMLGYTPDEWLNHPGPFHETLHPDDLERVMAQEMEWSAANEVLQHEYRLVSRSGQVLWIRDEAKLVRDAEGRPFFWQGLMYDITDAKRAEAEIERALEKEREAADQLRTLDEMKDLFLQAVSHDMRTPLSAVLGLAVTLNREEIQLSEEERRELTGRLDVNARKLDRILVNLLDLERLLRGRVEPTLEQTDVGDLVRTVVAECDFVRHRDVRVDTEPVMAPVDRAKVERIVENLLLNAVKHTPDETPIWVRVRDGEGSAVILVEDSGPGVPEELRALVFEPFRQGDPKQPSPGTGVGLSLVSGFAELHGGRAWVEPREGGGASFRVSLPAAPLEGPGLQSPLEEERDPAA
jgi:PAS domain S-box-containing protein